MSPQPDPTPRSCAALSILRGIASLALLTGAAAFAQDTSSFNRKCASWIEKKGYSVDYIEQRTGIRQTGMAATWRANLEPKDAQPGDIVFQRVEAADLNSERAQVVEQVLTNPDGSIRAFRVSEMNIGKMVEPSCHITENFGKVTMRNVPFERILRAWRPAPKS